MESARNNKRVLFLTDAVQTSAHLNLHEGYSLDASNSEDGKIDITVAVTRKRVLKIFWNLAKRVGKRIVPCVYALPQKENITPDDVKVHKGEASEKVILESGCADFDDVLLHDGRMMFELNNVRSNISLQLTPEKLIVINTVLDAMPRFESALNAFGIPEDEAMDTILYHDYALVAAPKIVAQRDQLIQTLGLELESKDL